MTVMQTSYITNEGTELVREQSVELSGLAGRAYSDGLCLLADIGGTNARFALESPSGVIEHVRVLACVDHIDLAAAIRAYLNQLGGVVVRHAALAIANPVMGDRVQMTNHHWSFSIEKTRQDLGLETLLVANDFTALAMSLPYLNESQKELIGGANVVSTQTSISDKEARGMPDLAIMPRQLLGLVGAGTGLGVSGLVLTAAGWVALNSEGGHRSFAPQDELEAQILNWMWKQFPHVSAERLISGPGIAYLYQALAFIRRLSVLPKTPQEIVHAARVGDRVAREALTVFSAMLGSVAGDVALTLGSLGGMYIGGGVVKQLGDLFDRDLFRARFLEKGRFNSYLARIPTYLITADYPAFLGVSAMLAAHHALTPVRAVYN